MLVIVCEKLSIGRQFLVGTGIIDVYPRLGERFGQRFVACLRGFPPGGSQFNRMRRAQYERGRDREQHAFLFYPDRQEKRSFSRFAVQFQ